MNPAAMMSEPGSNPSNAAVPYFSGSTKAQSRSSRSNSSGESTSHTPVALWAAVISALGPIARFRYASDPSTRQKAPAKPKSVIFSSPSGETKSTPGHRPPWAPSAELGPPWALFNASSRAAARRTSFLGSSISGDLESNSAAASQAASAGS